MKPDAQSWDRLQELFHLAEAVPVPDRERFLQAECPDPDLRSRVLKLLAASRLAQASAPPPSVAAPDVRLIGPYTVLSCIGSGGMGTVYLVERETGEVRQRAALKVIAGHAGGPAVIDRFRREERILASLDHPYIPRMLDAGVTSAGQPYLVMEFVAGAPLDAWCDHGKLSVEQRLRLFLKVCEAVDYAHRNLIVHLDLKPANILVTAAGAPKLLDFGTSKLIDPDGRLTTTLAATPSYASPEQLRNEPVTTACDIYSLGAILYELLAGQPPTGQDSIAVIMERAVEEREPTAPEQAITADAADRRGTTRKHLREQLSSDLSTIVRKCLAARPADRYLSVNALAADIERYLTGRPVLARPQTVFYRMRKFARRHRMKLAVSAVTCAAMVASLAYAWWGQQQAIRQGQRAIEMQTFLYRLFRIANSNYTGKPATTVKDLLGLGVTLLPEYVKDEAARRRAQLSFAECLYWSGDSAAAGSLWTSVAEHAHAAGDSDSETESLIYLSRIAFNQGQHTIALERCRRSLELSRRRGVSDRARMLTAAVCAALREELGTDKDDNLRLQEFAVRLARARGFPPHEVAQLLYAWGVFLSNRGRLQEASAKLQEALDLTRGSLLAACDQGLLLQGLAGVEWKQGNHAESARLYGQAHDTLLRCNGPEHRETLRMAAYRGAALARTGHAREAIPRLEANLPLWRKVFPPGHVFLVEQLYALSLAYDEAARWHDDEAIAREGLLIAESKTPPGDKWRTRLHQTLGRSLAGQARCTEARPHLEAAGESAICPE